MSSMVAAALVERNWLPAARLADNSVAWGDPDNDGRLDLLISGLTNTIRPGILRECCSRCRASICQEPKMK